MDELEKNRSCYGTNYYFQPKEYSGLDAWKEKAELLKKQIKISAGIFPKMPYCPLNPVATGKKEYDGFTVENVIFESLPGLFVAGNLYIPSSGSGPFPAILNPHGHWDRGRFEQTELVNVPMRCVDFAKNGMAAFSYDMIGKGESMGLPHGFRTRDNEKWGISLLGLQLWNSIRCLDYLCSLPFVDPDRIGCTGASGGGTQTFLLAAIDERVKAAAPVNMISFHMQGGCECENAPGLRFDTNNVELASLIAPRPMLVTGCTGDWTCNLKEEELPAIQAIYRLFNAEKEVNYFYCDSAHNYRKDVREAVCNWFRDCFFGGINCIPFQENNVIHFTEESLRADTQNHRMAKNLGLAEIIKIIKTAKASECKRLSDSQEGRELIREAMLINFGILQNKVQSKQQRSVKLDYRKACLVIAGEERNFSKEEGIWYQKTIQKRVLHCINDCDIPPDIRSFLCNVVLELNFEMIFAEHLNDQLNNMTINEYNVFNQTKSAIVINNIIHTAASLKTKGFSAIYLLGTGKWDFECVIATALSEDIDFVFLQTAFSDLQKRGIDFYLPGFEGLGGLDMVLKMIGIS